MSVALVEVPYFRIARGEAGSRGEHFVGEHAHSGRYHGVIGEAGRNRRMCNSTWNKLCGDAVGHGVAEDAAEMHRRDATDRGEFGNCDCTFGRYVLGSKIK